MERRYFYLGDLLFDVLFGDREFSGVVDKIADYCEAPIQNLEISEQYQSQLESVFAIDVVELLETIGARRHDAQSAINTTLSGSDSGRLETKLIKNRNLSVDGMASPRILGKLAHGQTGATHAPASDAALQPIGAVTTDSELRQRRHEAAATLFAAVHALSSRMRIRDARTAIRLLGSRAATAIVDGAGLLIDFNEAFADFCRRHGADATADAPALWQLGLDRSTFSATMRDQRRTALVRHGSSGPPAFFCTIVKMPAIAFSVGSAETAMVTFREVGAANDFDRDSMIRGLNLTEAEADTAIALASGMNTAEISSSRGVTVNTTRSLIKRALSKTGTRSQAELVSVISQYRL